MIDVSVMHLVVYTHAPVCDALASCLSWRRGHYIEAKWITYLNVNHLDIVWTIDQLTFLGVKFKVIRDMESLS